MTDNIEQALGRYCSISLNIINALQYDDYNALEGLLNEREALINDINSLQYSKDIFEQLSGELELLNLENRISSLMKEKRVGLIKKMGDLNTGKIANASYYGKKYSESVFFNKKL